MAREGTIERRLAAILVAKLSVPLKRFAQNALPKAKERLELARRLAGGRACACIASIEFLRRMARRKSTS
jgi:hypothetical protein